MKLVLFISNFAIDIFNINSKKKYKFMNQFIYGMCCNNCITAVEKELRKLRIKFIIVNIGGVELENKLSSKMYIKLHLALLTIKMGLIDSVVVKAEEIKDKQVEQACFVVLHMFGKNTKKPKKGYSKYIADEIHCNKRELGRRFVICKKITLRRFIIDTKMDIAKELILKRILSLTEIASYLHYKDYYHFCHQFIEEIHQSPSHYKC